MYNYYKQAILNTNDGAVKIEILYIIQISIALSILLLLLPLYFYHRQIKRIVKIKFMW